ncbi:MAG: hypothetical protein H5U02_10235 [Clostridia bacterium]|nr:hypothetical protein [Clostridia bacterium]
MPLKIRTSEITGGAGLLISILLSYPEVAAVNYNPQAQVIKLTFVLKRQLTSFEENQIKASIEKHLDVFAFLNSSQLVPNIASVNAISEQGISLFQIVRDVNSLSPEEISLIIGVVRRQCQDMLLLENPTSHIEGDLVKEELIASMLEMIGKEERQKKLVAFRHEGKVMVYDQEA